MVLANYLIIYLLTALTSLASPISLFIYFIVFVSSYLYSRKLILWLPIIIGILSIVFLALEPSYRIGSIYRNHLFYDLLFYVTSTFAGLTIIAPLSNLLIKIKRKKLVGYSSSHIFITLILIYIIMLLINSHYLTYIP